MLPGSYLSGILAIRGKKVSFTTLASVPGARGGSVGGGQEAGAHSQRVCPWESRVG